MPLILAIEPDRRQAAQLSGVVRRRVGAELILVDTTERALDAIGNRVPDLVLVPALLSPQDDAALATALRVIAATTRVQVLTIPVLAAPRPIARAGGVLSALRRDRSRVAEPDGCDPTVFAEQVSSYLERAAQERASAPADVVDVAQNDTPAPTEAVIHDFNDFADAAPVAGPPLREIAEAALPLASDKGTSLSPAPVAEPHLTEIGEPLAPATDDGVSLALEEAMRALFVESAAGPAPLDDTLSWPPVAEPSAVSVEPATQPASHDLVPVDDLMAVLELVPLAAIEATERSDWAPPSIPESKAAIEKPEGVIEEPATNNRSLTKGRKTQESLVHTEPSTVAVKSELEWVALIDSLRHDVERLRTERSEKPASQALAPRSTRPGKKVKPIQDEWGLFDPEQCGFAALLAKLEEVTESEESSRA